MSDLETELAAIPNMSTVDLADRWEALDRGAAPRVPLRVLQFPRLLQASGSHPVQAWPVG